MRKTLSLVVMAIFLFSLVPIAIAHESSVDSDRVALAFTREEDISHRIEDARIRFQGAKERYLQARQRYLETRQKVHEHKEKYNECKDVETEECSNVRKETKADTKQFLLHSADVILASLEKLKHRVEASTKLTEEEAAKILADIDAKIAEVQEARAVIENLDENSTPEEIKAAAQTIRSVWKDLRPKLKVHNAKLLTTRIAGIIVKSEHLETKLEKILTKLEAQGVDTSELNSLLDDFSAKIDEAKALQQEAVDLFNQGRTEQNTDLIREATAKIKEAHNKLKEAHNILREFVMKLKETREGTEELEEAEEDDNDEGETEEE